jgi:hypothetical protein
MCADHQLQGLVLDLRHPRGMTPHCLELALDSWPHVSRASGGTASDKEIQMTVNELIAELKSWSDKHGDHEVRVITPDEDETGPVGDDATVLTVAPAAYENLLVLTVG